MTKKTEILSEKQSANAFVIVKGFNDANDKRFEAGTIEKPHFVFEADFPSLTWKSLIEMDAVERAVEPEILLEDEEVIFEKIEN